MILFTSAIASGRHFTKYWRRAKLLLLSKSIANYLCFQTRDLCFNQKWGSGKHTSQLCCIIQVMLEKKDYNIFLSYLEGKDKTYTVHTLLLSLGLIGFDATEMGL